MLRLEGGREGGRERLAPLKSKKNWVPGAKPGTAGRNP